MPLNYVDYFYFSTNCSSQESKVRKPNDPLQSSSDEQELQLIVPVSWLYFSANCSSQESKVRKLNDPLQSSDEQELQLIVPVALVRDVFVSDSIIVLDGCYLEHENAKSEEGRPKQPNGKCCVERRKRQRKGG